MLIQVVKNNLSLSAQIFAFKLFNVPKNNKRYSCKTIALSCNVISPFKKPALDVTPSSCVGTPISRNSLASFL